ncbi:MAG: bifunctional aspartate kinase/diaminopimelate decarboxylase [Lysobacteraceae bacterium]
MSAFSALTATNPAASTRSAWSVLKFGGTSVSKRSRWDTIGRLALARRDESGPVLVVVSAVSGVTNALLAIIEAAQRDADQAQSLAAALCDKHREFAASLDLDADAVIGQRFAELHALAVDARATQAEFGWQAELQALGELMSSALGEAYLRRQGIPIRWIDARDHLSAIVLANTTAWAARLSVNCHIDTSDAYRAAFAEQGDLLITQGFIARDEAGQTCILGRGGSDTSAAYFGARLQAARVEIWTDVPGMFSANPREVPQARLLGRLDYEEAQEIATTGAKVLHPRCIGPCRESRVPLWIRDTERPELAGTLIDATAADAAPGVKAISTRKGIVLVSMESIGMWQQVGFLADVFGIFRAHGLSVDLIGSAESNVTVSLDPSENLVSSNVIDALCADLAAFCRVKVIVPCSAITLVGRGMRSLLHKLSDVMAVFGRERVHLISQSSNDLNLTFVVDESVAEGLLPKLHELLIASGAMPVDETAVFGPSWRQLSGQAAARAACWWQSRSVALLSLAAHSPRYVYHLPTARARAQALAAVEAVDRRFYAIKANPHPTLLRTLVDEGYGLECVSQGELSHVFASVPGLDPLRVLFTPSFAGREEYHLARELGVRITLDSVYPLEHWPELFHGLSLQLRIDPGFGSGHHEKVRTGGKGAKFGLPPSRLAEFLATADRVGARIVGLHAHIGSGVTDAAHWRTVYSQLAGLAEQIGTVESIDVGGGLGVPYEPDAPAFDLDAYAQALAEVKSAWPQYELWIEPGRYLVAEAGVLLTRVTQCVDKLGVRRIGVDAGMNALIRPALYGAYHEIVNLSRLQDAAGSPADVVGPICESGDVLGRRRRLPDSTQEGDVLLIATAGAYGAAMASTYNLRALPAEELLDD